LVNYVCDSTYGCLYTQKNCSDGDPNTYDYCDEYDGTCVNVQIPCAGYASVCQNMSNACYLFRCSTTVDDVADNCDNITVTNCDTDNKCVIPSCDNTTGCEYSKVTCQTPPPCFTASCDPEVGCFNTPFNCDDQNPCTTDVCNAASNKCVHTNMCTQPTDVCAQRWCQFGECREKPLCLLSDEPCFVTTGCNITAGCVFAPKCLSDDPCTIVSCDLNGDCLATPKACDDGNDCTVDSCLNGVCTFAPLLCDDGNACTVDTCNPESGCVNTPVDVTDFCNDWNACTLDFCVATKGCVHQNISSQCDDGDNCTTNFCDAVHGCIYVERSCPNSGCEIGYCRGGQCLTTKTGCIPPAIVVVVIGGGVGIAVAIIILIIICICCVTHGGAYYHGLYAVALGTYSTETVVQQSGGYGDSGAGDSYGTGGAGGDYAKPSTSATKDDKSC